MKLMKTKINGKMSCVHGSDESILLKCPYDSKPLLDSVKSLPQF